MQEIKPCGFKRAFDVGGGNVSGSVSAFVYVGVILGCCMLVMRHREFVVIHYKLP